MAFFTLDNWPLIFLSAAMIVAAVIDGWKFKVPNWLTFPLIFGGWALGLAHNLNWSEGTGVGGIGASLSGTGLGFALLLPVYAIGGMGAGDVKMQMGFGSWIGAFFGLGQGLQVIFYAFAAAVLIGGIMALAMMIIRGQLKRNVQNTREIVGDWFSSPGIGAVAEKAAKRKSRLHLLPYGIPLCLGFVGYLVFLYGF